MITNHVSPSGMIWDEIMPKLRRISEKYTNVSDF